MAETANILEGSEEECAAARLSANADYRVLRRMRAVTRFHVPVGDLDASATRVGAVLDVETTGKDRNSDKIIELAVQRFRFDALGRIVELGTPKIWREDPGVPLDPAITKLTGLTEGDLAGQAIDDRVATSVLRNADVIIAHNAAFDRPFVERRLESARGHPWACTMEGLDWLDLGFDGRALAHLVAQCGWFYEAHRAENDVLAVLYLLAHQTSDGETILKKLIARAEQPTWQINAVGAPYDMKDRLKGRGYRWNPDLGFWWTEVCSEALEAEKAWLATEIYLGRREPAITERTWHSRYSQDAFA